MPERYADGTCGTFRENGSRQTGAQVSCQKGKRATGQDVSERHAACAVSVRRARETILTRRRGIEERRSTAEPGGGDRTLDDDDGAAVAVAAAVAVVTTSASSHGADVGDTAANGRNAVRTTAATTVDAHDTHTRR